MWTEISYRSVNLFRLRPSHLTDSGIQSLLVPAFWTIRTAILAQSYRIGGRKLAEEVFNCMKNTEVMISPPPRAVKSTTCWRGLGWKENSANKRKNKEQGIERNGFNYREYVAYNGNLRIALQNKEKDIESLLLPLAARVNYFGKWGSFFQCIAMQKIEELDKYYAQEIGSITKAGGVPQQLDEWSKDIRYEMIDATIPITCNKNIVSNEISQKLMKTARDPRIIILPYEVSYSPEGLVYYQWRD